MPNGDRPPEPQWLFYVLSFIIPVAGIIIGAIYMGKGDPESRAFGKNCIIAALVCIGLICVCYILYFVFALLFFGLSEAFPR